MRPAVDCKLAGILLWHICCWMSVCAWRVAGAGSRGPAEVEEDSNPSGSLWKEDSFRTYAGTVIHKALWLGNR
jgi:hypothetical protein